MYIKEKLNGKIIVVSPEKNNKDSFSCVPLFCPLCNFSLKDSSDTTAYLQHKVCFSCSIKWAAFNFRPNKKSVEWKEYLKHKRTACSKYTFK